MSVPKETLMYRILIDGKLVTADVPFGGYKQSGVGREGGVADLVRDQAGR